MSKPKIVDTTMDDLPAIPFRTIYQSAAKTLTRIHNLLKEEPLQPTSRHFAAAKALIEILPDNYASKFLRDWFDDLIDATLFRYQQVISETHEET